MLYDRLTVPSWPLTVQLYGSPCTTASGRPREFTAVTELTFLAYSVSAYRPVDERAILKVTGPAGSAVNVALMAASWWAALAKAMS